MDDANDIDRTQPQESVRKQPRSTVRPRVVWSLLLIASIAFVALARVPTHLGVKAMPWDKRGSDYVWRVWWRAKDDLVQVRTQWLLDVALFVLVAAMFLGCAAALWIALHDESLDTEHAEPLAAGPDLAITGDDA